MDKYNPQKIEPKWQEIWKKNPDIYIAKEDSDQEKKYILDMFPYPSGEGLHVGHVESYTATDIISRFLRMNGKNVLHPQGWDAFGLPAENYAIKTKIHPAETTKKSIATFKGQMNKMGFSYDWFREVNSSDPEYYKWTQWFFLLLYKNGLAYKKKAKANWCPSCQTVLANEQVVNGKCERCGTEVIQKDLEQWFLKITDFIENKGKTSGLISGLDKIDWPDSTKAAQKNWIGRSEGTQFKMPITGSDLFIEVYTTRLDTAFGITYAVVAPEHPIVSELKEKISNWKEVEKYLEDAKKKTDLERMEAKVKTGVKLQGIKVVNPFNNEEVPLFVADYVLSHYGTGAVMAVPAHDERDFEFAKRYNLPMKIVIEPCFNQLTEPGKIKDGEPFEERDALAMVVKHWEKDEYIGLKWKKVAWQTLITGGVENDKNAEEAARREVLEETGYKNLRLIKELPMVHSKFYHVPKKVNRFAHFHVFYFELENGEKQEISKEEQENHEVAWVKKDKMEQFFTAESHKYIWQTLDKSETAYTDDGVLNNSKEYNFLTSAEARKKITAWLEKNKLGERKINYKIRDWLVSRQRYWGAPIPIIYCEKCGTVPVPEKDLPVMLPTDVDFKPTGESPLKYSKKFQDVKCSKCDGKARRESDTMDTFVCSSWYYFRYADPKNAEEFASKKQIKKWLPVDLYVGGAEHSVLHLLYSRFFTKVLHNLGYIDFDEPFLKLRHQGIILAEDGRKMSKSLGNVINPDDIVNEFGADSLRLFEMFMGPLEDMKPWQTNGIVGVYRFLEKVWRIRTEHIIEDAKKIQSGSVSFALRHDNLKERQQEAAKQEVAYINTLLHKTIKRVTENINNLAFNTAISQMMIFVNEASRVELSQEKFEKFLIILSSFAPHISEELWEKLGHKESIFLESWPKYDPKLIKDEEIELVIQVNGKLRDRIKVAADISEEEAKKTATESEKVKNFIAGKEIKKIIFVKGKLINIVL
ncbi:MAG: leucine--tRNA ligase [Candidatus Moranbacteria bacterium CG_4_9_14_3_um_filter_42_9]|nr:MAG: leucine--tRNA ligase [Candidatus Moranbacteria bacterium CG_4_9_14_3_um_filter_42_9]